MKSKLLLLACLTCIGGLASTLAASPEVRTRWVAPLAQPVIERAEAALATLEGWSATIVFEDYAYYQGKETRWLGSIAERFLKGEGSPNFYSYVASSNENTNLPTNVRVQNATAAYRIDRPLNGRIIAQVSVPDDGFNRPALQGGFLQAAHGAQYVSYGGREVVNGQACDVVECISVNLAPATPDQPERPASLAVYRYHVDPAGIVVRSKWTDSNFPNPAGAGDAKAPSPTAWWGEWRLDRFDVKAEPAAEEFSREAFDRIAATMLKPGEVMPEVTEQLFRRGERLPEMNFIAWADKKPFRLADLKGKIVVVETWASWCHFCKEAFPYYEKMRQKLEAQDVVFVAVSFDEKPTNYEKWMNANAAKYGFKFGLVDAPDAKAAMKQFRGALPAFYVLGRDGEILSSYVGYIYAAGNEDPRLLNALRDAGVKL